jgi:hypothetical protein
MTDEYRSILNELYGLRTHPFAPEIGPDGNPVDPSVLSRTLDPYNNSMELRYFYDFYEWHNREVMADIDQERGLSQFRSQQGDDPLLIILSGYNNTGRRSLARLARKQIRDSHAGKPMFIEVDLSGNDTNVHARELAKAFIDYYAWASGETEPKEESLRTILRDASADEEVKPGTGYQSIFRSLRMRVRQYCPLRPIVFEIRDIDRQDTWQLLYKILSPLANYLVIITTDETEARVARNNLQRKPVKFASVTAPRLDYNKAEQFVRFRFEAERQPGHTHFSSLAPFDPSAIAALFASSLTKPGGKVEWQIQWIIENLRLMLDRHLQDLKEYMEEHGGSVAGIPEERRLIRDNAVNSYFSTARKNLQERSGR